MRLRVNLGPAHAPFQAARICEGQRGLQVLLGWGMHPSFQRASISISRGVYMTVTDFWHVPWHLVFSTNPKGCAFWLIATGFLDLWVCLKFQDLQEHLV